MPHLAHDLLREEIRSHAYGGIVLGVELRRLDDVARVEAPDAVIFYAARILEGLSARAATRVAGMASANVFGNLVLLAETGFLGDAWAALAHALRRLGNDARHGLVSHETMDSDLALALLERTLAWYFVHGALGPRVPSLTEHSALLEASDEGALLRVVDAPNSRIISELVEPYRVLLERSPVLTGLVAESWIRVGGEGPARALELVERSLARFPDDARLRQLRGWGLRLVGREIESVDAPEALLASGREDDETLGLLGGAYKRRWARERSADTLARAAALYSRAWKRSSKRSAYAGVNAATTALLSGARDRAHSLADEVVALYEARRGRLAPGHSISFAGYWDLVSLAEAELVAGDVDRARLHFNDAFARYRDRPTHVASTRDQLSLLLPALDLERDPERWLRSTPTLPHAASQTMSTYEPRPMPTEDVEISDGLREAAERLAEHIHDTWAQQRIAEGWRYGERRDDVARTHPDLVPYADLPEGEKEYDRRTALETIRALVKMGYRIDR